MEVDPSATMTEPAVCQVASYRVLPADVRRSGRPARISQRATTVNASSFSGLPRTQTS